MYVLSDGSHRSHRYVTGEDSHLVELSLSRNAFQSTTRADGHSDADLATDSLQQTCSRTQAGGASWWKVDLGATHIVVSITVDIGGCCPLVVNVFS